MNQVEQGYRGILQKSRINNFYIKFKNVKFDIGLNTIGRFLKEFFLRVL